jgi:hypothetical protein
MDRDFGILRIAMLATALSLPVVAAAQAPPKTAQPVVPKGDRLDLNSCGDNGATVGQGGEVQTKKPGERDLSERLAQSGGVICPPPYVDPAIKSPTPPGGSMPVIPPPGSPGSGDRSIQPK